jgi:hypothetical protein
MFNHIKVALVAALILSATCASFAKSQGGRPGAARSEKDFWEWRHSRTYLRVVDGDRDQPRPQRKTTIDRECFLFPS